MKETRRVLPGQASILKKAMHTFQPQPRGLPTDLLSLHTCEPCRTLSHPLLPVPSPAGHLRSWLKGGLPAGLPTKLPPGAPRPPMCLCSTCPLVLHYRTWWFCGHFSSLPPCTHGCTHGVSSSTALMSVSLLCPHHRAWHSAGTEPLLLNGRRKYMKQLPSHIP